MASKPELAMSFPLSDGRVLMWRWHSPFTLDWTWGIQINDGPIEWFTDFQLASWRFDAILEDDQMLRDQKED